MIFITKFRKVLFVCFTQFLSYLIMFMSVGWDDKWCPVSRITTPWHAKGRFSGFCRRVGSWGPPGKLQNFIIYHLPNSRRRCMAKIQWNVIIVYFINMRYSLNCEFLLYPLRDFCLRRYSCLSMSIMRLDSKNTSSLMLAQTFYI